ncbi:immunity protein YezG family protein [Photorhabdus africana]|uniref:immunity protein YezG family protein n=1 Tax=Photorhabdus africana TaxID=3097554 RepID=UPI002B40CD93|nr:immunity protein YezG family protein [Photorhabdus sp. CRI-LC]
MMRDDQEIYNDIGKVLFSIAPDDASKVIVNASLEPKNDSGEFTYDYVNKNGEEKWINDTYDASPQLLDLLVELRIYLLDNFKSEKPPFWHSCVITLDIEKVKLNVNLKYED